MNNNDDALANYRRACDEYRAEMARMKRVLFLKTLTLSMLIGAAVGFAAGLLSKLVMP